MDCEKLRKEKEKRKKEKKKKKKMVLAEEIIKRYNVADNVAIDSLRIILRPVRWFAVILVMFVGLLALIEYVARDGEA
jgi:RNA-splicing ligase RtcB